MTTGLQGKRVTLVGGAGFIGHNLALKLKAKGVDVSVVDGLHVNNLLALHCANSGGARNQELYSTFIAQRIDLLRAAGVPLYVQDARDYHMLSRLLTELKPQVIVHLAAVAHANKSNKDPLSTFDHSLRTLENALDWSRNCAEHFVFFSSSMVYGNFLTEQVSEDHPLNPMGIYGALKVGGEKLVQAYQQVFDLPYTIVRPSALYGPRCVSRRVGQIFVENALAGQTLRLDGDGSEKLDFTYIDDLTEGLCLVIEKPEARNEIFNLTYGSSRSIRDLANVIVSQFPGLKMEYVERDKLMPFRGTLNVDKARQVLGYEPRFPIDLGFLDYIRWYRQLYRSQERLHRARQETLEEERSGETGGELLTDPSIPR